VTASWAMVITPATTPIRPETTPSGQWPTR
jgi:hypothetical protein